jgi:hypothetical protein
VVGHSTGPTVDYQLDVAYETSLTIGVAIAASSFKKSPSLAIGCHKPVSSTRSVINQWRNAKISDR